MVSYDEPETGLRFVQYTEDTLRERIPPGFHVLEAGRYREMEGNDWLVCPLRAARSAVGAARA